MAEATITLPNVRQESAVQMHAKLKDNGVALDWTSLSDVKAYMYSDAQRVIAGRCTVEVNGEDSEVLNVLYPATAPQYLGRYSLLLRCTYQGREKTFDVPVLTFVERTAQATGVTVITDPEMDVQLAVEDVSTSLLDGAIAAALDAAVRAAEAAAVSEADHLVAVADHEAAEADHTRAGEDHTAAVAATGAANDAATLANAKAALVQDKLDRADTDHTRAESDHTQAVNDHDQAGTDHGIAGEDHTAAVAATGAANDAATLANAKAALVQNKLDRADTDHARAESDHTQAGNDHTQAGTDHGVAADDHTQAVADHAVMEGYDTRLGAVETEATQLDQIVNGYAGLSSALTPTASSTKKYLATDGTLKATTSGTSVVRTFSVEPGVKYMISGRVGTSVDACLLAFYNAGGTLISYHYPGTGTGTPYERIVITAPEGAATINVSGNTSNTAKFNATVARYEAPIVGLDTRADEIYGKSFVPETTIQLTSKLIMDDGSLETYSNYVVTDPIAVKKGQKVTIHSYMAKDRASLALTDAQGSSYTPVIINRANGAVLTKDYVATADCYVAWNYNTTQTHEISISAAADMLAIYEAITPKDETGINDFNPVAEFEPKFIAAKKETNDVEPLVILAFSDIHGSAAVNLPRILEFYNTHASRIDEIINLGDSVSNQYSNDFVFGNVDGAENIISIIGNHDTATSSEGAYDWTAHAGADAYNKFISPFVSNWGVTQPENAAANGYCYFYKDYATQGIRIVFLDVMGYDATQEAWLETVLADAKTNSLSVLIAAHYPSENFVGFECKYSPIFGRDKTKAVYNPDFYTSIGVVKSFVSGGGTLIGWLTGHRHDDLIGKLQDTDQICLIVDTAQYGQYAVSEEYDKVQGTPTQDAFSIISIDTEAKTFTTFKVGCRRDRWQRTRDSICVDYETGTILCEN